MAAKTVARTRTARAVKSTSNTEKKAPQPIANRYRGKCAECGEWVGGGEGIATPPATKGEKWSTHHGHIADNGSAVIGPCPKPANVKSRATNNKKKDTTMAVRRTRKPAPKKTVEKFSPGEIAALSLADLRTLAKELELDEQMRKAGILSELEEKGYVDGGEESTPAPAKKTTARKVAAKRGSASASDEEAAEDDDEMGAALAEMLDVIKKQISSGALDEILGGIDDAITERLEKVAEENAPAKKTAARKTTTPRSKSEKLAPVKRGSASAKVAEPEEEETDGLVEGKIYNIGGKSKLTGARAKFVGYKDGDNTRAIVVLTKAHGERPRGAKVSLPVSSIVK